MPCGGHWAQWILTQWVATPMTKSPTIKIKRIYDPPADDDGLRVLVDRLWPRGVKKEKAGIDYWAKDLAPTIALRKWFDHQPARFDEFRTLYLKELDDKTEVANEICSKAEDHAVTLLYAARDRSCNYAVVLQDYLSQD